MRVAVVAAGGAALAVLALLIATTVTGSQALAWATGTVGLLAVTGTALLVLKMVERYSRRSDQTSTRTANLEKRVERSGSAESEHAEALTALGADVEALRSESARARQVGAVQKQVRALERTVKILHRRVPEGFLDTLQADVADLKASTEELERRTGSELSRLDERTQDAWTLSTESAFQLGRRPRSFLTVQQAMDLFEHYQAQGRLLEAGPLLNNYGLSRRLDLGTLRGLYRFSKTSGYWDVATLMLQAVAGKSGRPGDERALKQLRRDVAVFSRPTSVSTDLPTEHSYSATGPIVHMVGRMLPETQSGFTLRTHYTARAQSHGGLPVVVVGQSGFMDDAEAEAVGYTHEGVEYVRLPGPVRKGIPLDDWVRQNIEELAKLVRALRPSILHAHSDFLNVLIVSAVGKAHGIPTVYESRGFWEESWLTRTISTQGWTHDAETLFATYGLPSAYTLRKKAETVARTLPDHNFTLA
ncbi:MAG: hypothetical protein L0G46_10010, partial [Kocuria sp.]|nr:hypothetical protein [Kocuria sp.]